MFHRSLASPILAALLFAGGMVGCQHPARKPAEAQDVPPVPHAVPASKVPSVTAELSSAETQVGIPVVLTITIKNAPVRRQPKLDSLSDFKVESSAGISGPRTTYSFLLTPTNPGTLTIPSVTIVAGDRYYQTETFTVVVSEPQPEKVPVEVRDRSR